MVRYAVFIIILSVFCVSCSTSQSGGLKQISFNDYQTDKSGAIILDDRALDYNQKQIGTTTQSTEAAAKSGSDSSYIKTMFDGFGNKIETRIFGNHPLLQRIIIRTFASGKKSAFVYGQNGDVNDLPADMYDKALNASADELAKAAGIFTGRDLNNVPYFLRITTEEFISDNLLPLPVETAVKAQTQVNSVENALAAEKSSATEKSPVVEVNTERSFTDYQSEINKMSLMQTAESSNEAEKKPKSQFETLVNHKTKEK